MTTKCFVCKTPFIFGTRIYCVSCTGQNNGKEVNHILCRECRMTFLRHGVIRKVPIPIQFDPEYTIPECPSREQFAARRLMQ